MVSPMEKIQQPQVEVSFDSLPFLFPDSWRPALLWWKKAAMEREGELARRRQARLQELQDYVRLRLEETKIKEQMKTAPEAEGDSDPPYKDPQGPTRDFPSAVCPPPYPISIQHPLPSTQLPLPATQKQDWFTSVQHSLPSTKQPHPSARQPLPSTQQPLPSTLPPPSTHSSFISPRRKLFTPKSRESHTTAKTQDPYARVTAMARGFLTRRLLQAQKVRDLIKTIKEANNVLSSLTTPMATSSSQQDEALKERVSIQLQVARQTLHEILFTLPVKEQMAYIAHSRHQEREQRRRAADIQQPYLSGPTPSGHVARDRGEGVVRGRLSTATMKAIERRRQQVTATGSRGLVRGTRTTTSEWRGQQIRRQRTPSTVSSSSRSQGGVSSSRSQGGPSGSRSQGGPSSSRSQGGPSSSRSQGGPSSSRSQGGPSSSRNQGGRRGPGRNTTVADTAASVPKLARPKKT